MVSIIIKRLNPVIRSGKFIGVNYLVALDISFNYYADHILNNYSLKGFTNNFVRCQLTFYNNKNEERQR